LEATAAFLCATTYPLAVRVALVWEGVCNVTVDSFTSTAGLNKNPAIIYPSNNNRATAMIATIIYIVLFDEFGL